MPRTALDALNDQDIMIRNHLQDKVKREQFDHFWTPEHLEEQIKFYQSKIDDYNKYMKRKRKEQMYG